MPDGERRFDTVKGLKYFTFDEIRPGHLFSRLRRENKWAFKSAVLTFPHLAVKEPPPQWPADEQLG